MKHIKKDSCDVEIFGNVVVWTKWQIVIPSEIRKRLSIEPGDSMIVVLKHEKAIWLIKSTDLESFVQEMKDSLPQ
jgi:AbrB family looped-hinge helix DNA binding protein